MLSAPSELLLRNQALFQSGKWLVINATDNDIFQYFGESVVGHHQYYERYLTLNANTKGKHFYSSYEKYEQRFDGVIIYWPKSKKHGLMLSEFATSQLTEKGILLIVGDNKGGIKSAGKLLDKGGIPTQKLDSARHCTLLSGGKSESANEFDLSSQINRYCITYESTQIQLQTLPGAFSSDGLDPGTELLLADLPMLFEPLLKAKKDATRKIHILDFACGNGVIGLALAKYFEQHSVAYHLTLSDVNAIALQCAEESIVLNQLSKDNISVISSDGLNQITEKFDYIVSNPPFHSGTKTDYSISEQFFRHAKQKLLPSGKLRIVANRFLKYPDQLESVYGNLKIITKNSKFSVYQCSIS